MIDNFMLGLLRFQVTLTGLFWIALLIMGAAIVIMGHWYLSSLFFASGVFTYFAHQYYRNMLHEERSRA